MAQPRAGEYYYYEHLRQVLTAKSKLQHEKESVNFFCGDEEKQHRRKERELHRLQREQEHQRQYHQQKEKEKEKEKEKKKKKLIHQQKELLHNFKSDQKGKLKRMEQSHNNQQQQEKKKKRVPNEKNEGSVGYVSASERKLVSHVGVGIVNAVNDNVDRHEEKKNRRKERILLRRQRQQEKQRLYHQQKKKKEEKGKETKLLLQQKRLLQKFNLDHQQQQEKKKRRMEKEAIPNEKNERSVDYVSVSEDQLVSHVGIGTKLKPELVVLPSISTPRVIKSLSPVSKKLHRDHETIDINQASNELFSRSNFKKDQLMIKDRGINKAHPTDQVSSTSNKQNTQPLLARINTSDSRSRARAYSYPLSPHRLLIEQKDKLEKKSRAFSFSGSSSTSPSPSSGPGGTETSFTFTTLHKERIKEMRKDGQGRREEEGYNGRKGSEKNLLATTTVTTDDHLSISGSHLISTMARNEDESVGNDEISFKKKVHSSPFSITNRTASSEQYSDSRTNIPNLTSLALNVSVYCHESELHPARMLATFFFGLHFPLFSSFLIERT